MAVVMLNGVLVGEEDATLSALDRALTQGLGIYETIKLIDGLPVFFEEHVARMASGLAQIEVPCPFDRSACAEQIVRLSEASAVPDGACRILVTAGPPDGPPALLITTDMRTFPQHPLALVPYRSLRAAAALKSNSFIASYVAMRAARAAGADDAVFVDDHGRMYEASTANLFVVRDGILTTPPAHGEILPGVVRAKLMEVARADGLPVHEELVEAAGLTADDMILLTSSVRGVVMAASFDGRPLRQDQELLDRLKGLVDAAERASTVTFAETYLGA